MSFSVLRLAAHITRIQLLDNVVHQNHCKDANFLLSYAVLESVHILLIYVQFIEGNWKTYLNQQIIGSPAISNRQNFTVYFSFGFAIDLAASWGRYGRGRRGTPRGFRWTRCTLSTVISRTCKPLCCCHVPLIAPFRLLTTQYTSATLN